MELPTMIARALERSRSLPPGRPLLDELERLGYPRDVRLGANARDGLHALAQCMLWTAACAAVWSDAGPDSLWTDAPIFWAGGIVLVAISMLVMRSRARFTLRASGIEIKSRRGELIAWDAIHTARLEHRDLVLEHEQAGRRVTSRGYIGYAARS